MKIYVCHSTAFDYKKDLYEPLLNSTLTKNDQFVLPHQDGDKVVNSRSIISTCDLIIAEVSHPSTGMGIELGWADKDSKKILFIYKKGFTVSKSLKEVSTDFIEYFDTNDLIKKLESFINKL